MHNDTQDIGLLPTVGGWVNDNAAVTRMPNESYDFLITGGFERIETNVVGGFTESYGCRTCLQATLIDHQLKLESYPHSLLEERYNHQGVSVEIDGETRVYVIGGQYQTMFKYSVERLTKSGWVFEQSMTSQRSQFSTVVLKEKIWAVGGFSGIGRLAMPALECFDPRAGTWTPVPISGVNL